MQPMHPFRPGMAPAPHRRAFLRRTLAASAFAFTYLPARVLGLGGEPPPSRKLNLAFVGVGGRGRDNLHGLSSENVVALCDVDEARARESFQQYPKARTFQDYRVMLDQIGKEIDAVVVSTPDHTHAAVALAAMQLHKHVYCEKPLAHSLHEVRQLVAAARKYKVVTQLGNQGHASDSIRQFCEMIWDGAVGPVREVHAWCQNTYRPRDFRLRPSETPPAPSTLNWDLWLGPAAERPYHPVYLPGKWRGWVPFGTGIIGDWTCHVLDPVFWALDLGAPSTVVAQAEEYGDPQVRAETYPKACQITYQFAAKGARPAVTLHWYTGRIGPRPEELELNRKLPGIGAVVVGDKGKILYGSHGAASAQLLPAQKDREYTRPAVTLPRSKGHHEEWAEACKGGAPNGSPFSYGGPLTEIALLGVLAKRFSPRKLDWDAQAGRITNFPEAETLLRPAFRSGWGLGA